METTTTTTGRTDTDAWMIASTEVSILLFAEQKFVDLISLVATNISPSRILANRSSVVHHSQSILHMM